MTEQSQSHKSGFVVLKNSNSLLSMGARMGENEALVFPGFGNLTIFCKCSTKKLFFCFEWEK